MTRRRGPAPAKENRASTTENNAAAKPQKLVPGADLTRGADSPGRLLPPLVRYVTNGRDHPALDRLRTAAAHGAELVDRGAERTAVVVRLVLAAEIAGVSRREAEGALRGALGVGGAR